MIQLKKCIIISKKTILKKYPKLDPFYINVLKRLYGEKINSDFEIRDIETLDIIRKGRNNLKELKYFEKKAGIYIFTDENGEPVYIGLAGKGNSGQHSLKGRIQKQLNADLGNSTIAKNIIEIESLLQNDHNILKIKDKNTLKKLIGKYAPKLIVISTGDLYETQNREKAQQLEKILIALLRPKYNK